jgi:CRISPR-associated protein Cas2
VSTRVLVSYDIETVTPEGRRRASKIRKLCKSFGVRVQYSIFECVVGDSEFAKLRSGLLATMNPTADSVRLYFIPEDASRKTEHHGINEPLDPEGPLVL